jgi:hypothetical protein
MEDHYDQLGDRITVMIKDGTALHPHTLRDPKSIADWFEEHSRPERRPSRLRRSNLREVCT